MPSLSECLEVAPTGSGVCKLVKIRDTLPTDEQTTLDGWITDGGLANHRIAKALTAYGSKVSESTVAKHRARICKCHV